MRWISQSQQQRDHNGLRNVCSACGHDERPHDRLVLTTEGSRQHSSEVPPNERQR